MARPIDKSLIGKRFGELIVLSYPGKTDYSKSYGCYWICRCDCGAEIRRKRGAWIKGNYKCKGNCQNFKGEDAIINRVYYNYTDGDISFDQFKELIFKNCHYCNAPPSNSRKIIRKDNEHQFVYNGLDRIDSSQPHNLDNVVTCCAKCNIAKRHHPTIDFLEWLEKTYLHSKPMLDDLRGEAANDNHLDNDQDDIHLFITRLRRVE